MYLNYQRKQLNKTCLPEAYATQSKTDVNSLKSGKFVIDGTCARVFIRFLGGSDVIRDVISVNDV